MKRLAYLVIFCFFLISTDLWAVVETTIYDYSQTCKITHSDSSWLPSGCPEEEGIKRLLNIIQQSPRGEKLLRDAKEKANLRGETLPELIKAGESSLTDTSLTRRFRPSNPEQVVYEEHSVIFINDSLGFVDALMDLTHELTHFAYRGANNPYTHDFSAKNFVRKVIEAQGGEADAIFTECLVLHQLMPNEVLNRDSCRNIVDPNLQYLSRSLTVRELYKVGKKSNLATELKELPLVFEKASFISSAYGEPYPIAAFHEFQEVKTKVCQNEKKRLDIMRETNGRSPASLRTYQKMSQNYLRLCQ